MGSERIALADATWCHCLPFLICGAAFGHCDNTMRERKGKAPARQIQRSTGLYNMFQGNDLCIFGGRSFVRYAQLSLLS